MSIVRMKLMQEKSNADGYGDKDFVVLKGQVMYLTTDRMVRTFAGDVAGWVALCDNKMTYRNGFVSLNSYYDNWGRNRRIQFCL